MNLPNKLTMARVIMIPFFVIFMLTGWGGERPLNGSALQFLSWQALTDLLDGHIARKHNLVTNFGKFMDPLADKLLVCSAMICLVEMGRIPAWIVIVIISREFIISGFRLIASDNGRRDRSKLLGQVQNDVPDGYDLSDDCQHRSTVCIDHDCNVGGAGADSGISGRLSDEKQRRAQRPALIRIKILLCRNVAFAEYFYEF